MNSLNKALPEQQDPTVFEVVFNMIDKAAPKKKRKGAIITGSTILDDVGMDSLEVLDVAMNLEEHYDLFIPDEDINAFVTLQDISDYLEKALAAKPEPSEEEEQGEQEEQGEPTAEAETPEPDCPIEKN